MLDGNAIAGTLSAAFGGDMTLVVATCAGCGARGPLAETAVYLRAPGLVARCRSCESCCADSFALIDCDISSTMTCIKNFFHCIFDGLRCIVVTES